MQYDVYFVKLLLFIIIISISMYTLLSQIRTFNTTDRHFSHLEMNIIQLYDVRRFIFIHSLASLYGNSRQFIAIHRKLNE